MPEEKAIGGATPWSKKLYIADEDLFNRFKAIASRHGKKLQILTEEVLRAYVEREEAMSAQAHSRQKG